MGKSYLSLQLKRVFKIYPTILIVTIITVLSIAMVCGVIVVSDNQGESKKKISVGIVGNIEDTYLDIGIYALENLDSSRFYIDVVQMEEQQAIEALKSKEINGYLHVPDGYIDSVYRGDNLSAKYVTLNSPEGFGTILSGEIAEIVSHIVIESQIGMYSMQSVANEYYEDNLWPKVDSLMMKYIDILLQRHNLFAITELGIADSLSFGGYYICGLLLFFMLLWGISVNKIFSSKSLALSKLLHSSGMTVKKQVVCEYLAYLFVTVITLFIFALMFGGVVYHSDYGIPELKGINVFTCIMFIVKILPVIIMITLMQTAVYEVISGNVAAVLAQFILAVGLGYVSGCFFASVRMSASSTL